MEGSEIIMYTCDSCKREFSYNEIVLLDGGKKVKDKEHGGSGDIDECLCEICNEVIMELQEIREKYGISQNEFSGIFEYIKSNY